MVAAGTRESKRECAETTEPVAAWLLPIIAANFGLSWTVVVRRVQSAVAPTGKLVDATRFDDNERLGKRFTTNSLLSSPGFTRFCACNKQQ